MGLLLLGLLATGLYAAEEAAAPEQQASPNIALVQPLPDQPTFRIENLQVDTLDEGVARLTIEWARTSGDQRVDLVVGVKPPGDVQVVAIPITIWGGQRVGQVQVELDPSPAEPTPSLADAGEVGIANRDSHMGNIVAATREPWLLIDPKPYLAERAFDAGYFVFRQLEHGIALGASELVGTVAENLGADRERVKAWAAVRALAEAAEAEPGEYRDMCTGVAADIERA
jgi:hypothetical protein